MAILSHLPPWAAMWLLACGLYAAGKCATVAAGELRLLPTGRRLAYLFLFPGMDPSAFTTPGAVGMRRKCPAIRFATNVLAGTTLLWAAARIVPPAYPLLRGWIGMFGFVLLLHFGLLQLLSLFWQARGFNVPLLMNAPIRSATLTEFWSLRWNTAFRKLSHQFVFRPLVRRAGPRAAMLLTFLFSGVVHDLVISVPAGAGFGLPTAYFLLQGVGVLFERSRAGRRCLRTKRAARAFAVAAVTLPLPLLFHSAFVLRVFVPFMAALGALPQEASP